MTNPGACAETAVEMWVLVDSKLAARQQKDVDPLISARILSESMKLYMTMIIKEKKGATAAPGAPDASGVPSEKQMDFALSLGCENPGSMTKKELSVWIDKHKKY